MAVCIELEVEGILRSDQDDVVMISSGSESGSPQKKERASIVLLSSESEPGTPEKPKLKRPRGRSVNILDDEESDLDELKDFLGPETPVYDTPKHGYSALEILQIVLGNTPSSKLCTRKPCGVRTFASFVVDLSHVAVRDLQADDNGSWTTSSPRRKYVIEKEGDNVLSARVSDGSTDDSVVTMYRQYGTHKGSPEFRRIIATVRDSSGKQLPKAVVQYYFIGGEKVPVQIPPHGNASRTIRPYYRTQPSTLKAIKQECKVKQPSEAYHHMLQVAGGVESSKSISEEPRNKDQLYNVRKQCAEPGVKSKDELFDLLEKLKSHQADANGGFLREVVVSSSPCAILASRQQLDSLVAFCCQPNDFVVFGVDATFELGDFYVTLTTYLNPLLRNPRSGKSPVFLGPAFIHMQRRFEDYYTFFAGLLKLEPQLLSLKAYGTDGEEALVKALRTCFPSAVGLRCFIHKQRNIEEHLKVLSATARTEIVRDIFGMREGEVFSKGLVDAETRETFDQQLQQLHKRWDAISPGFHKWFVDQQANTFRNFMIAPIREMAHLGSPPRRYTTNSNESANCAVKRWVGFTKSSWPAFVDKLENLVESQQNELSRAVYRSGEYVLAPHMLAFQVDQLTWHHMTTKKRVAHIEKMVKSPQLCSHVEDRVQSVGYERLWSQGDEGVLTQGEERSRSLGGERVPSPGEERLQSLVGERARNLGGERVQSLGGERSQRLGGERVLSAGEERSRSLGDERVPSLREERVQNLLDESVCSQMEERSPNQVEQRRFHKLSVAAEDIELSTVPKATAQGIWGKAARLLNTPGSISKAPGNDSAFMVASQTSKKPHFVQVSANGKVVCDELCPMWRGRKLCAHTVAVAEKAQALPQFVQWLQKSNRECNLTKLVTTSKEKRSAGTKAGKPSRRSGSFRQTTPITAYRSRIDDVCTSSSEHMDAPSKDLGPNNSISVDASNSSSEVHISGSMYSSSSYWYPPSPYSYPYHPPSHFNPYGASSSYGYRPDGQPYSPFPPNPPPVSPVPPPPYAWSSPSFTPPSQRGPSNDTPFVVKILNNRIKKCRGCGALFLRKVDGSPPDPPNDLVIAHEERRPFTDAQNVARLSRPQNVHYHPSVSCIRRQNPSFIGNDIYVPGDLTLLNVHEKYLFDHFGWHSTTL